jgi:hypothetical protein
VLSLDHTYKTISKLGVKVPKVDKTSSKDKRSDMQWVGSSFIVLTFIGTIEW